MSKQVLALGQLSPQLLGEADQPWLCGTTVSVESGEVLEMRSLDSLHEDMNKKVAYFVVDINAIKTVLNDPCGHRVRSRDGVRTGRGGLVAGTEGRNDKFDASGFILGLDGRTLIGGQRRPLFGLVPCTLNQEEGQSA